MPNAKPLKWTQVVVRVLLVLFAAVLLYDLGRAVLTGGENTSSSRGTQSLVCAPAPGIGEVDHDLMKDPAREATGGDELFRYPVEKGVEFAYGMPDMCVDDSSFGSQLLYQSARFATMLVVFTALVLLERLVSRVRRGNGFDEAVVRGLRFLGLFLAGGALAASLYTAVAGTVLAGWMVAAELRNPWGMIVTGWDLPWAYLIAGLGLVVLSRVVRVGASMREELEGTV